jgi:hypothetical protein
MVPALVCCDGHYAIDGFDGGSFRPNWADLAVKLTAFAGWIRFEGNGTAVVKRSEEYVEQLRGQWTVLDEVTIRIELPISVPPVPRAIIVQEGDEENTILVSLADALPGFGTCRYTFVPEEENAELPSLEARAAAIRGAQLNAAEGTETMVAEGKASGSE